MTPNTLFSLAPTMVGLPCTIASSEAFQEWLTQNGLEVASNSELPDTLKGLADATASPYGCLVMFQDLANGPSDGSSRGCQMVPSGKPRLARFVDQVCVNVCFEYDSLKAGQNVLVKRVPVANAA